MADNKMVDGKVWLAIIAALLLIGVLAIANCSDPSGQQALHEQQRIEACENTQKVFKRSGDAGTSGAPPLPASECPELHGPQNQ